MWVNALEAMLEENIDHYMKKKKSQLINYHTDFILP